MTECLCCKKNESTMKIHGNYIVNVCGQSNCRTPEGKTLGEWILDDGDLGHYGILRDKEAIVLEINNKKYAIPNDKRIIKGLHNKIRDIVLGK